MLATILFQVIAGSIISLIIGTAVGGIIGTIIKAIFRRRKTTSLPAILGSSLGVLIVAILPVVSQPWILNGGGYAGIYLNALLWLLIPSGSIVGGIIGSVFGMLFTGRIGSRGAWISFFAIYLLLVTGFYIKNLPALPGSSSPLLSKKLPLSLAGTIPQGSPFVCCMAFSSDGNRLAIANSSNINIWQSDSSRLLATFKGTPRPRMDIEQEDIKAITFAPDNRTLAIATERIIKVVDVVTGKLLHRFDGGPDIQFTPDGRKLIGFVNTSEEKPRASIRMWDIKNGKALLTIPLERDAIDLVFPTFDITSDGRTLIVSPAYDNRVQLRDLNTGKLKRTWKLNRQGEIKALMLTPDDRTAILSQNDSLLFLDLSDGRVIKKITEAYNILNLMIDLPGERLIGCNRSELKIWQLKTGNLQNRWDTGGFLGIASKPVELSPDGKILATYTSEGTVKLWHLPPALPTS